MRLASLGTGACGSCRSSCTSMDPVPHIYMVPLLSRRASLKASTSLSRVVPIPSSTPVSGAARIPFASLSLPSPHSHRRHFSQVQTDDVTSLLRILQCFPRSPGRIPDAVSQRGLLCLASARSEPHLFTVAPRPQVAPPAQALSNLTRDPSA